MSNNHITFELKVEHIALLRAIVFEEKSLAILGETNTDLTPFGGVDLKTDLADILVGRELTDEEKEACDLEGVKYRTRNDYEWMLDIYKDILTALNVVHNTQSFVPGTYRTRWYERNWKKID